MNRKARLRLMMGLACSIITVAIVSACSDVVAPTPAFPGVRPGRLHNMAYGCTDAWATDSLGVTVTCAVDGGGDPPPPFAFDSGGGAYWHPCDTDASCEYPGGSTEFATIDTGRARDSVAFMGLCPLQCVVRPYDVTRKRFAMEALQLVDTTAYYPECALLLHYAKSMLNANRVFYMQGDNNNAWGATAYSSPAPQNPNLGPDFAAYQAFMDSVAMRLRDSRFVAEQYMHEAYHGYFRITDNADGDTLNNVPDITAHACTQ